MLNVGMVDNHPTNAQFLGVSKDVQVAYSLDHLL